MTADARTVAERLVRERPAFHEGAGGELEVWHASPRTLELIARHVGPGDRTLETGAGASTVVFAAAGASHLAISPHGGEHERIRAWLRAAGVDDGGLRFVAGYSDRVLPGLELDGPLDVALVDGKHSFPHPVVDVHYVSGRLRVGGVLIADDAPIPAVAVALRALVEAPEWDLLEVVDGRAAALRKLAEAPGGDDWPAQPFNRGFPDWSFLPPARRAELVARHRAKQARGALGRRLPALRRLARRDGPSR
jgi:predicted O-methyltransferase YrrM